MLKRTNGDMCGGAEARRGGNLREGAPGECVVGDGVGDEVEGACVGKRLAPGRSELALVVETPVGVARDGFVFLAREFSPVGQFVIRTASDALGLERKAWSDDGFSVRAERHVSLRGGWKRTGEGSKEGSETGKTKHG